MGIPCRTSPSWTRKQLYHLLHATHAAPRGFTSLSLKYRCRPPEDTDILQRCVNVRHLEFLCGVRGIRDLTRTMQGLTHLTLKETRLIDVEPDFWMHVLPKLQPLTFYYCGSFHVPDSVPDFTRGLLLEELSTPWSFEDWPRLIEQIGLLPHLRSLAVSLYHNPQRHDTEITGLHKLSRLVSLKMRSSSVLHIPLHEFSSLSALKVLHLDTFLDTVSVARLCDFCPLIEDLSLGIRLSERSFACLAGLKNLTSLNNRFRPQPPLDQWKQQPKATSFPSLRCLTINGPCVPAVAPCSSLTKLQLTSWVPADGLQRVWDSFPNLEHVELCSQTNMTDRSLQGLAGCSSLRYVSLEAPWLSACNLEQLLRASTLEYLSLRVSTSWMGCFFSLLPSPISVSDELFSQVPTGGYKLTSDAHEHVFAQAAGLPRLTVFEASYECDRSALEWLLRCPRLRSVKIGGIFNKVWTWCLRAHPSLEQVIIPDPGNVWIRRNVTGEWPVIV